MLNQWIETERAARDAFLTDTYFSDERIETKRDISNIADQLLFAIVGTIPFVMGGALLIAYIQSGV